MKSIRKQLLFWLLSTIAITGSATAVITYFLAWSEFDRLRDNELLQVAYSISRHGIPTSEVATEIDQGEFISQIWDANGILQYSSSDAAKLPLQTQSGLTTHTWRKNMWRIYTMPAGNGRIIQVAHSVAARKVMLKDVSLRILLPIIALLPVIGGLIWLVVGRSLVPLEQVRRQIDTRTPNTLTPLGLANLPAEITPMVDALNRLLLRLETMLHAQRQFIADAAHELRSPLTAVRLQAQVARRVTDPAEKNAALQHLESAVDRATHMVQQLLDLARTEPEAITDNIQEIDLSAVIKQVVSDYSTQAEAQNIDLGVTHIMNAKIAGHADNLRILVSNLVDNAIRYTPSGGQIDVSLTVVPNGVQLEVSDTGSGIAAEDQHRIFDRFYRGSNHSISGSGLGLSIVKSIAESLHAEVTLQNQPNGGLSARVVFHNI